VGQRTALTSPAAIAAALFLLVGCGSGASATSTPILVASAPTAVSPVAPTSTVVLLATASPTIDQAGVTATARPAAPSPSPISSSPTAAAIADWPVYNRDNTHTGVDPAKETFATIGEAWRSLTLDGDVYAQPLVVGGQVYVATNRDTVYDLDATTGRIVWQVHLAEPIPRSQLPCGDIDVTGITSTPVADHGKGLLYVVTFGQPGRHELVALDLASGAIKFRQPIDPPGANPLIEQQRAALAIANGMVYVAYGGLFGDCGEYHGWLVAASAADGSIKASYQVPSQREAGIWAPSGPAVDSAGSVYVSTGNSGSTTTFDDGNAVIRFSAELRPTDWFAAANWVDLNLGDTDIGSVGPALLDRGLIFQIGKAGVGYLLQASHLGHEGGQVFSDSVCRAAFGGTAYVPPLLFVPCTDGLVALQIRDPPSFTVRWRAPMSFAGPPIVKAGAVWSIARDGTLYGVDPNDGNMRTRLRVGTPTHFATPSVAGRFLLVAAARQILAVELK
jgi:outer membrane protein assembly factor BamB